MSQRVSLADLTCPFAGHSTGVCFTISALTLDLNGMVWVKQYVRRSRFLHVSRSDTWRNLDCSCKRRGLALILWDCTYWGSDAVHLGADHTHDLIPDTDMVMAHPLARAVPQVAKESIHAMRLAGMSMGDVSNPSR